MGDVAVENPANQAAPYKRAVYSAIPTIDNFEGVSTDGGDDYANLKKLQRQLEYDAPIPDIAKWRGTDSFGTGTFNCKKSISRMNKGNLFQELSFINIHNADCVQESEARAGSSSGRDQAYSKRSISDWPVYGGD